MINTNTIDYTNKDYNSLRRVLLELARYRLPEWTDRSPADFGMLMIDLFSYMGDIILYYQDRIANESFLQTAVERRSIINLLRLIGYELKGPVAATAELTLTFKFPVSGQSPVVTIPHCAQFSAKGANGDLISFEYCGPSFTIDLTSSQVRLDSKGKLAYIGLPVRQSHTIDCEIIGSSSGEPNQSFKLSQSPLIPESLIVEINDSADWVMWDRREGLLYYTDENGMVAVSDSDSHDYYVQCDESDNAYIFFGDGVYGKRPVSGVNNIRASYSVGGGLKGNVAAGSIKECKSPISLLDSVTNPFAAAGGADHESIDQARKIGPLVFRSGNRAVTLSDCIALAFQVGGVAKVRARARSWNQIDLYIAPEGTTCQAAPEDLRNRILAFFEDKRMMGTFINVQNPQPVPVNISLEVVSNRHFRTDAVRQAVDNAVQELLAFKNVDFGKTLYLSEVYGAIEKIQGVYAVTVTRFHRNTSGGDITPAIPPSEIETDGRIDIGDFEIPVLGEVSIIMKERLP